MQVMIIVEYRYTPMSSIQDDILYSDPVDAITHVRKSQSTKRVTHNVTVFTDIRHIYYQKEPFPFQSYGIDYE